MVAHPAYTLFMMLALAVFLLTRRLVPGPPSLRLLPWRERAALGLAAFSGGCLGAKLPFALAHGSDWLSEGAWLADGKTITTGLIGAYLAVEATKLLLGIRIRTGDAFALPLALALAVGRWGCFFNGCCYGVVTALPWGVDFGDGIRRHPTQVYECLFHLTMAGVLAWLIWHDGLREQRLKLYLIAYGIFRFFTEFIRPEPVWAGGLTFYQWAALGLIIGLAIQWALAQPASPKPRTAAEHRGRDVSPAMIERG
jgi:phosphatidylglycerol:prolipoprotein diacylglycerol transferase